MLEFYLVATEVLLTTGRRLLVTLDTSHGRVYLIVFDNLVLVGEFGANQLLRDRSTDHRACYQSEGSRRHGDGACAL